MVLDTSIIQEIKSRSGLEFNKVKDFVSLSDLIMKKTGRSIGVTTLKRLMGNINDTRKANLYTLDTISKYLGYASWNDYTNQESNDSQWNYPDDTVYISSLKEGQTIELQYLNRKLKLYVINHDGQNALKVISSQNSSLQPNDILHVYHIRKGEVLEAQHVFRGSMIGNYKSHGIITSIIVQS